MTYKKSKISKKNNSKKNNFRRKSRKVKKQRGRGNVTGKNTPVPEKDYDLERAETPVQSQMRFNVPSTIMTNFSLDDYDVETATPTPVASINTRQFSPLPYGSRPTTPFQMSGPIIKTTPTRGETKSDVDLDDNDEYMLDINKIKREKEDWNEADMELEEETKKTIEKLRKKAWSEKEIKEYEKRKKDYEKKKRIEDLVRQESEEARKAMSKDADKKEVQLETPEQAYQEDINRRIKKYNKWFTPIFQKDRKNKGGKSQKKRKSEKTRTLKK
jgi:hypothetical protein